MFKRITTWLMGLALISGLRTVVTSGRRAARTNRFAFPAQTRTFAFPWQQRRASRVNALRPLVLGLGLGAAFMYLFDTRLGNRRRALVRDQATHMANVTEQALGKAGRDLENRATGVAAEMQKGLGDVNGAGQSLGRGSKPASQGGWSPAARMLGGVAGTALAASTFTLRGVPRVAGGAVGLGLLARSITNLPVKRLVGVGAGRRAVDIQKAIVIQAPVDQVFDFYSNFENFPRFMTNVREVRDLGEGRSHWVVDGPAGISAQWNARLTGFEPNRLIAWRSEEGSPVGNGGVVRFDPDPQGGTRLTVRMSYNPPAGALGHAVATVFNSNPKQAMNEDLGRLKSLIETGQASVGGQRVRREDLASKQGSEQRQPAARSEQAYASTQQITRPGEPAATQLTREPVGQFAWEGRRGKIPRQEWERFCETFGEAHPGWLTTVDETDATGRRRIIASEQPLLALSYEKEDGPFNLRVVLGDDENETLAHMINDVQSLYVEPGDAGIAEGLSISSMQGTTHVRVRSAAWSGAQAGLG